MSDSAEGGCAAHYERHLAAVYAWMQDGAAAAIARAEAELDALGVGRAASTRTGGAEERPPLAVDLGAGFGAHALPLARRGFDVVAVDASEALLAQLRDLGAGLSIRTRHDDLVDALDAERDPIDLLLCMGDTLTHLESPSRVRALCAAATARVRPGGRAVFGFRDYTSRPEGERAFFCVRGDAARIASCALEIGADCVRVHDLLHERSGEADWTLRASSYRKLRLAPAFVEECLGAAWRIERHALASGLTAICAERNG